MRGRCRLFAIILGFGLASSHAQHTTWTGTVLGDWFNAANWTDGIPVETGFSGASATINTGLALISPGSPVAKSSELIVGGAFTGSTAGLGLSGAEMGLLRFVAGRDAGTNGLVSLSGSTYILNLVGGIIGGAGTGVLTVTGSSRYSSSEVVIGQSATGIGTVEINGAGSSLSLFTYGDEADLVIGAGGSGTLKILNGAEASGSTDVFVSLGEGGENSEGTLEVSGSGSYFRVHTLTAGTATIEARNGGVVSVSHDFQVLGASTLAISGASEIGSGGGLSLSDTSTLVFTLASALPDGYGVLSAGHLSLAGTFRIELAAGYQPELGDSFSLLDFVLSDGAFTAFDLPDLEPGLFWDTSSLASQGVLHVVPEPSIASLVAVALAWLGAGSRARRRPGHGRA
jgi:T5SS/PEP-CTERM-associated repeat protein